MAITAHITIEDDALKAVLSDGRVLFARDPRELAGQLVASDMGVDDAHCADWREGKIAPLVGQAIALKTAMRQFQRG